MVQDEKVKNKVYKIIGEMARRIGVQIPVAQYPEVLLTDRVGSSYNPQENTLVINRKDLKSGDAYGEEVSHFIRTQVQPKGDKREAVTSEFFGYLGRRILSDSPVSKGLKFDSSKKPIPSRTEALAVIRASKQNEKKYQAHASGQKVDPDGLISPKYASLRGNQERFRRVDVVAHQRGYHYADQLDLGSVDLSEAYSLPNSEVRKRFFRSNKTSVESRVEGVFLASALLFILFLAYNSILTGFVSLDNSINLVMGSVIGALLFVCLIVLLYLKFVAMRFRRV